MLDGVLMQALIYKNGSWYAATTARTSGTSNQGVQCSALVDVAGADEIEGWALLGGAGDKTIEGVITSTYLCRELI